MIASTSSSRRRRRIRMMLIEEEESVPPICTTRPVVTGGWARLIINYSYVNVGFPGVPLVASPGIWTGGGTVIRRWWRWHINPGLRVAVSANGASYTPTVDDRTNNSQFRWIEEATNNSGSASSQAILIISIKEAANITPAIYQAPAPTGGHMVGDTITRVAMTWTNPVPTLGDISVVGQWIKNEVGTGVSATSYSNTSEGDSLVWRETATNAAGSTTVDSPAFLVSSRVALLAAGTISSVAAMATGNSGGSAAMNVFSAFNHSASTYTRNASAWCINRVGDFTGCAAYKKSLSITDSYGGVLITPRHLLFCRHAHPWSSKTWTASPSSVIDATTRFITSAGAVVNLIHVGQAENYALDLCVAVLDSAVPGSIHVSSIIEFSAAEVALLKEAYGGAPLIAVSQGHGRGTATVPPLPISDYPQYNDPMYHSLRINSNGGEQPWPNLDYQVWDGDSGTPAFLLYGGEAYLFRIITSSGGQGPHPGQYIDEINAMITACDLDAVARHNLDPTVGMAEVTGLSVVAVDPFA